MEILFEFLLGLQCYKLFYSLIIMHKSLVPPLTASDEARFSITPVQQMLSATTGALITSLFMTPIDVVKIRLQTQQRALISNKCFLYCNGLMDHLCPCGPGTRWFPKKTNFNGTLDAFVKITKLEGVSALWSGLSPTLVLALPCTVIYFVTYEQLRLNLTTRFANPAKPDSYPFWVPMFAGAAARVTAVTVVNPLELIRTKMQSQEITYSRLRRVLQDVWKFEGLRGLWRGLSSTLFRDVPFSGIYWTTYESIKGMFGSPQQQSNTFAFNFAAGAVGGCVAAVVTVPFDVIKTRQQIEIGEKEIYTAKDAKIHNSLGSNCQPDFQTRTFLNGQHINRGDRKKAKGVTDTMRTIVKGNGIRGLFAGLMPRVIKVAPACAIMIATFEYGKSYFHQYNKLAYEEKQRSIQDKLPRHPACPKRPAQSIIPPPYEGRLFTFGPCSIRESCVFHETKLCYAFVNLRCVVPGHVLVAPLRRVGRVRELTAEESEDLFKLIVLVVKVMELVHNATSSTMTIQDGPDAGQTIDHVHCHVMPRHPKDFEGNDRIYVELAKHDQPSAGPLKPARTMSEMEKEAAELRKVFQENR